MTLLLAAFKAETSSVYHHCAEEEWQEQKGHCHAHGRIHTHPLLLGICGMGPVAAAMHAQYFVDHYSPQRILLLGIAGSLQETVALNDLIIPLHCVAHPSITTGQPSSLACDASLQMRLCEKAQDLFPHKNIHRHRIMTSCQPLLESSQYPHDAVDMEAWAVALVARKSGIPLAVVKSISDLSPRQKEAGQSLKEGVREANKLWVPLLAATFY